MAQYQQNAVDCQFGIIVNALPSIRLATSKLVIVATHQMLGAIQPREQLRNVRRASSYVTQVPYLFLRADHRVPVRDDRLVHLLCRGERPAMKVNGAVIAEVSVGGEE